MEAQVSTNGSFDTDPSCAMTGADGAAGSGAMFGFGAMPSAGALPPAHSLGTVLDVDKDAGTVTIEIENYGEWTCGINDVVIITEKAAAADKDDETLSGGVKPVPALQMCLAAGRGYHGLKRIVDAAQRPTKFVVGDVVRFKNPQGGGFFNAVIMGTIRAVVTGGAQYVIEQFGDTETKTVEKADIEGLVPFKAGDKVRMKRTATGFPPDLPEHMRFKAVAKVLTVSTFASDSMYLHLQFPQGSSFQCMSHDCEVVDDNYQWYVKLVGDDETAASTGACVSLERGFQDGERAVGFLHKDRPMFADFSTFRVYEERDPGANRTGSRAEAVQSGASGAMFSGAVLVGYLRRDPDEHWSLAEEKKVFDDGKWHVLTILVNDNIIAAFCDGEKIPTQYEGTLVSKVQDVMSAAMRGTPAANPFAAQPPATGDEDETTTENSTSPACPPRTIASHLPLMTNAPVAFMHTTMTSDEFRKQAGMPCGNTFPRRLVSFIEVTWDAPDINDIIAGHVLLDTTQGWTCRSCRELNSRQADTCAQCGDPRTEKKGKGEGAQGKVRAVNPRSREAQAVRRRVQNKLRSQYQRLLDSYDDSYSDSRRHAVIVEDLL
jgi:hypothetical protein